MTNVSGPGLPLIIAGGALFIVGITMGSTAFVGAGIGLAAAGIALLVRARRGGGGA